MVKLQIRPWRKYSVLASMYFAQGVPGGFILTTLLYHLYEQGLSKEAGGQFLAIIGLPWVFKLVLGPLVDKVAIFRDYFGRRFSWSLLGTFFMFLTFLCIPLVENTFYILLGLVFCHNLFRSLQDVATDGFAVMILEENERAPAQSAMRAASFFGQLIGGSAMLFLASRFSWIFVCYTAAFLIVVFGILIPILLPAEGSLLELEKQQKQSVSMKELLASFKGRAVILLVLMSLLAHIAEGFSGPVVFPWFNELGYDKEWVSLILAVNGWFKLVGAILGGVVVRWLSNRMALKIAVLFKSMAYIALSVVPALWASKLVIFVLIMFSAIGDGLFVVLFCTVVMDHTKKAVSASQFAVFMALMNLSVSWSAWLSGVLAESVSIAGIFLIGGICQLLLLLPLFFLRSSD